MDVLALYRAERRESYGLLWQMRASEEGAGPSRTPPARPAALNPPSAPVQVVSPSPDGLIRLVNGSARAGSTPEGLKFWLGV